MIKNKKYIPTFFMLLFVVSMQFGWVTKNWINYSYLIGWCLGGLFLMAALISCITNT